MVERIDLHSHLLPGLDDGCQSVEESIRCVQRLVEHGFVGTVCTPHMWMETFPENTPENVARAVCQMRVELERAGVRYQLWPGGELRMAPGTIGWLEEAGVPTLGEGRAVLVDYWGSTWPKFADDLCRYLIERGYQPILAHPERMGLVDRELEAALAVLEEMGVWLQGNFNSWGGGEGPYAAARARRMLDENRYYVLALDMHGADSLQSRFEGMGLVAAEVGQEKLTELLEVRPKAVLGYGAR